jgi:hypothetical protein
VQVKKYVDSSSEFWQVESHMLAGRGVVEATTDDGKRAWFFFTYS